MTTPRTLQVPLGANSRGGARTTVLDEQGREATLQLLMLELSPPGACADPWGQEIGLTEEVVFDDPVTAEIDLRAQLVAKFDRLERAERARLLQETVTFSPDAGRPGGYVLAFDWKDLRRNATLRTTVPLGGMA